MVSDRAYVLEKGQIRWNGAIGDLMNNQQVQRAYLTV
jgi:branched-chain amino acid transport system ATP-binding protein